MKRKITLFLICVFVVFYISAQSVNDKVEVLWNNQWFKAKVLEVKDGQWFITYDGYGAEWNEWVGSDRIKTRYKVGDKINVLWKEQWYPSTILEFSEGQYKIHYDGYDAEWDEWVTTDRMKK